MQHSREGSFRPALPDIIATITRTESTEEAVVFLRDAIGFDHVTYHMAWNRSTIVPFIRSTYPPQWVSQYVLRGYIGIDPVVRRGFVAEQPFAWHELPLEGRELEFMAQAREQGVGNQGYSIPVADRLSRRALLSLTSSMTLDSWNEFIDATGSSLIQIAHLIHHKAVEELLSTLQPLPTLAPREAECLLWTARGKEAKVIATILDLSEYTVRSYLRTARRRLDCRTLSQAVAKAIQLGIIDP